MKRFVEKGIAVASFVAAVIFAFTALIISENHEIAAGHCTIVAQFLLLTASIFGLDYKINNIRTPFKHHENNNEPKRTAKP